MMTDEEILALGIQADLCDEYGTINWEYGFKKEIIAFAKLVAEKEREACAKLGEDEINRIKPIYSVTAENIVKAIRARGQQ